MKDLLMKMGRLRPGYANTVGSLIQIKLME